MGKIITKSAFGIRLKFLSRGFSRGFSQRTDFNTGLNKYGIVLCERCGAYVLARKHTAPRLRGIRLGLQTRAGNVLDGDHAKRCSFLWLYLEQSSWLYPWHFCNRCELYRFFALEMHCNGAEYSRLFAPSTQHISEIR